MATPRYYWPLSRDSEEGESERTNVDIQRSRAAAVATSSSSSESDSALHWPQSPESGYFSGSTTSSGSSSNSGGNSSSSSFTSISSNNSSVISGGGGDGDFELGGSGENGGAGANQLEQDSKGDQGSCFKGGKDGKEEEEKEGKEEEERRRQKKEEEEVVRTSWRNKFRATCYGIPIPSSAPPHPIISSDPFLHTPTSTLGSYSQSLPDIHENISLGFDDFGNPLDYKSNFYTREKEKEVRILNNAK